MTTVAPQPFTSIEVPLRLRKRFLLACRAAEEAGAVTMNYFQRDFDIDEKADGTVVTTADREAETRLREIIREAFPEDGLVGEEYGEERGGGDCRWILDPIDGTKSFACGVPLFGTLLAVERAGVVEIGVMTLPALGETIWAVRGCGAWHGRGERQPTRVLVSQTAQIAHATVCTTSYDYFRMARLEPAHERLCQYVGSTRGWSDCYAQLLLATGRVDAVVEPLVYPWDVAPVQVIVEEAGGRYSDWQGEASIHSRTCLTSNGRVHDALMGLLRESP